MMKDQITGSTSSGAGPRQGSQGGPELVRVNSGLEVVGLGKRFKNRPVLRDVSVTLRAGRLGGLFNCSDPLCLQGLKPPAG